MMKFNDLFQNLYIPQFLTLKKLNLTGTKRDTYNTIATYTVYSQSKSTLESELDFGVLEDFFVTSSQLDNIKINIDDIFFDNEFDYRVIEAELNDYSTTIEHFYTLLVEKTKRTI